MNYQEKFFAAGRIPGGFFKREGRPTEKETLVSRLIDRPIRPLFPHGFKNEVQVIVTVLSHDLENDPDILSLVAASAALTISGIPFFGPVGAARVGYIDGAYVLNPTTAQKEESKLDLVLAGTTEGVLMVESEASELSEEVMLGAVTFGHAAFQPVIQAIIELAEHSAKDPWALPEISEETKALTARVDALARDDLRAAYTETVKQVRQEKISAAKKGCRREADRGRPGRREGRRGCLRSWKPTSSATTSWTPACASTAATPRPFARSWPKSACCRAPMARRCSPVAKPRRWSWRRWAPRRMSR